MGKDLFDWFLQGVLALIIILCILFLLFSIFLGKIL